MIMKHILGRLFEAAIAILMALQFLIPRLATAKAVAMVPRNDNGIYAPHCNRISIARKYNFQKIKKAISYTDSRKFFTLKVKNGEKLGNIFSRTISYKSKTDSFPEVSYRASGTGIYTVLDNDPEKPVFDGVFKYDGRPESKGKVEISNFGKTQVYNGKSATNTDGSGLLYNSFTWGIPPEKIKSGDTWKVNIPEPWELGGPGTQTVTVIATDEKNNTVTLKREGTSEGFYDNDAKKIGIVKDGKTIKVNVIPGQSHWVGYTIFRNGLVISDELLVTRPVTLSAESLKYDAIEREYILLNAMPVS
jgi:hypothetical protein